MYNKLLMLSIMFFVSMLTGFPVLAGGVNDSTEGMLSDYMSILERTEHVLYVLSDNNEDSDVKIERFALSVKERTAAKGLVEDIHQFIFDVKRAGFELDVYDQCDLMSIGLNLGVTNNSLDNISMCLNSECRAGIINKEKRKINYIKAVIRDRVTACREYLKGVRGQSNGSPGSE